jgi:hypothetical protein
MSAAISAAGYLYASGRLRARNAGRSEAPLEKPRVPRIEYRRRRGLLNEAVTKRTKPVVVERRQQNQGTS